MGEEFQYLRLAGALGQLIPNHLLHLPGEGNRGLVDGLARANRAHYSSVDGLGLGLTSVAGLLLRELCCSAGVVQIPLALGQRLKVLGHLVADGQRRIEGLDAGRLPPGAHRLQAAVQLLALLVELAHPLRQVVDGIRYAPTPLDSLVDVQLVLEHGRTLERALGGLPCRRIRLLLPSEAVLGLLNLL